MTDKEKIRAEIIKRRKAISKEEDDKRMKAVYGGIIFELTEILEFIDSLPVEPKFMVGQVVRSSNGTILKIIGIGQYCYHCDNDYSFGFDIQDEFELVGEPASEDLKDAIEGYVDQLEFPDKTWIELSATPKDLKNGDKVKLLIVKENKV